MLKNYAEVVVAEVLDAIARIYQERQEYCFCPRCREDISAIALNRLPPRYLVRDEGYVFTHVEFDKVGGRAEVIAAVMYGLETVRKNPRHGKERIIEPLGPVSQLPNDNLEEVPVVEKRCILCGRKFVPDEELTPQDDEDELLTPRKTVSVCQLCQAKLKHEADEAQKLPKPM